MTFARRSQIAVVVVAVTLGGCGGGGSPVVHLGTGSTTTTIFAQCLGHLFVTPAGFHQDPDAVALTGPIDIAKAAYQERPHETVAILEGDGFLGGYQRIFHAPDGGRVLIYLYEFRTGAGARDYPDRQVRSDLEVSGVVTFSAARIPDAVGLLGGGPSRPSTIVWLLRGRYAALVGYDNAVSVLRCETTNLDIAHAQYARL